jgi:dTDP-4-amino-4,6-dideoxygalactose transaminase
MVKIPLAKPLLGDAEVEALRAPIESGWVTQGPEVAAFEREFAARVGAPYACAVANCTVALHLALRALRIGPGDEVLTVSHSFIATANSVRYTGAVPVFVDIDPATFNLDPTLLERATSPRTRAVLCVHQLGMPCDLRAILSFAHARGLPVIEDAACAIGSEVRVGTAFEPVGKPHGDVACFSFHPRKVLTTGDGGMLTTARGDLDAKFRLWRHHGMNLSDTERHAASRVSFESFVELGYNYRLTDLQAAIGRVQLRRLDGIIERRRALADRYRGALASIDGVEAPHEPPYARSNWQSYCVRLSEHLDQRGVMQSMLDLGVATRRGVACAHRQPVYAKEPWSCGDGACAHDEGACPHLQQSERAEDHAILLPLYPQMTDEEQACVVDALRAAVGRR